jgi:hypothetical protein
LWVKVFGSNSSCLAALGALTTDQFLDPPIQIGSLKKQIADERARLLSFAVKGCRQRKRTSV